MQLLYLFLYLFFFNWKMRRHRVGISQDPLLSFVEWWSTFLRPLWTQEASCRTKVERLREMEDFQEKSVNTVQKKGSPKANTDDLPIRCRGDDVYLILKCHKSVRIYFWLLLNVRLVLSSIRISVDIETGGLQFRSGKLKWILMKKMP